MYRDTFPYEVGQYTLVEGSKLKVIKKITKISLQIGNAPVVDIHLHSVGRSHLVSRSSVGSAALPTPEVRSSNPVIGKILNRACISC